MKRYELVASVSVPEGVLEPWVRKIMEEGVERFLNTVLDRLACGFNVTAVELHDAKDPKQVDLDGPGQWRQGDPDTSRKAAVAIYPRAGTLRHRVLRCIAEAGDVGATAHEIEQKTGIEYRSLTPRIGELRRGGLIRSSGTRKGAHGTEMNVLRLTDLGTDLVVTRG